MTDQESLSVRSRDVLIAADDAKLSRTLSPRLKQNDWRPENSKRLAQNGAWWAEYPDMEVVDVRQNGRPINGRPAIIKKAVDWY